MLTFRISILTNLVPLLRYIRIFSLSYPPKKRGL